MYVSATVRCGTIGMCKGKQQKEKRRVSRREGSRSEGASTRVVEGMQGGWMGPRQRDEGGLDRRSGWVQGRELGLGGLYHHLHLGLDFREASAMILSWVSYALCSSALCRALVWILSLRCFPKWALKRPVA